MSLFDGLDSWYCVYVMVANVKRESVGQFEGFVLDDL